MEEIFREKLMIDEMNSRVRLFDCFIGYGHTVG